MDFAAVVYILCTLTSLACAVLLWRGFARSKARLLLWSTLCFIMLSLNNLMLFADKVVWPDRMELAGVEFPLLRATFAFTGIGLLLFGLIWDSE